MKYLIKDISNKKTWNKFVETVASESYFQSWEWGEVEMASGKTVWRLGIYEKVRVTNYLPRRPAGELRVENKNKTINKLIGVSQITKVKAKRASCRSKAGQLSRVSKPGDRDFQSGEEETSEQGRPRQVGGAPIRVEREAVLDASGRLQVGV
ncbi:MAG: hypothetical protein UU14_C0004G0041, partial [Candidatus Roizmanbacteria bacterium GW2011_GWB1_40_7]